MVAVRRSLFALLLPLVSSCVGETVLGFEIGDIGGLWIAAQYEFVRTSSSSDRVNIIARDGASFILSVDDSVRPPIVGSTLDDGSGMVTSRSGTVDIRDGTIALGDEEFVANHDRNRMTLINEAGSFDFGNGTEPATVVITLDRV